MIDPISCLCICSFAPDLSWVLVRWEDDVVVSTSSASSTPVYPGCHAPCLSSPPSAPTALTSVRRSDDDGSRGTRDGTERTGRRRALRKISRHWWCGAQRLDTSRRQFLESSTQVEQWSQRRQLLPQRALLTVWQMCFFSIMCTDCTCSMKALWIMYS